MSFAKSSTDISIDASTTDLSANCRTMGGGSRRSVIRLNEYVGNNHGRFVVGGKDFGASATNIHLIQDTNNHTTYLVANLRDRFGSVRPTLLDLNSIIANKDGRLAYVGSLHTDCYPAGLIDDSFSFVRLLIHGCLGM
ncbi:hypothetical protein EST38_g3340 [Candolleomyces aberdarensis]|uniref:Cyanovirin-N domain-containing protein n=1 Tax=Candolleomyces aberdarensis TaxID=2316362 RepID=A0A4Q2DS92_9AGAR|nr:hypothetical protein EST38_g3340 [Candolleomyces aberdarensis]